MVTFKGKPNELVRLNPIVGMIRYFRFDDKGLFSTDNPRLIARCKAHFPIVDGENKAITSKDGGFNCKKCDYVTPNRGELMAHYRKDHPKEG